MNADGTDAHEILADEPALAWGASSLTWSPAGDHIAMASNSSEAAIYTFAPDGSDFTALIFLDACRRTTSGAERSSAPTWKLTAPVVDSVEFHAR